MALYDRCDHQYGRNDWVLVLLQGLDKEEDRLNALPESTYIGRKTSVVDVEAVRAEQEKQDKFRKAQGLQ